MGCTPSQIQTILGDGWSFKTYGSNRQGWEFSIFIHQKIKRLLFLEISKLTIYKSRKKWESLKIF